MEEEDVPRQTRGKFERNYKYETPEIENKIVELRKDGKSWKEITDIVKLDINEPNKRAGKKFTDHTEALDKMYGEAVDGLSKYVNAINVLSEELDNAVNNGKLDVMQKIGIFIKTAGAMKAIYSELREMIKIQNDQQDKILLEQKDQIWSEEQMLDYMKKYLDKLEHEGKIIFPKEKLK